MSIKDVLIDSIPAQRLYRGDVLLWERSRLPSAYQEVEYIESHGQEWINTLEKASNSTQIDCEFYITAWGSSDWIGVFGQRNGRDINALNIWLHASKFYAGVGSLFPYICDRENIKYAVTLTSAKVTFNGVETSLSGNMGVSNSSIFIFNIGASTTNGYRTPVNARFYTFKITQNGVLTKDFVPCYRKADGVIGMYDIINDVFYTNDGKGTFKKGPDA